MRTTLTMTLALLALATTSARADDKTLEDYAKLVTPALRKVIDEQFVFLNRWPDKAAQAAATQLIGLGEPVVPDLSRELQDGHWRAQVASAYIAGELKVPILFDAVARSATNPAVRKHLAVYFRALSRIDDTRAFDAICTFVGSRYSDVRRLAYRHVAGLVKPAHEAAILRGIRTKSGPSRAAFVGLLGALDSPTSRKALLEAHDDESPEVADAASVALARHADKKTVEALVELLADQTTQRRYRGYVTLTLVRIEDRTGEPTFPESTHESIRTSVLHVEPFVRGTAAVALANIARHTADAQIIKTLDQVVVPVLIKTMSTATYFKDYGSVREIARDKLSLLTGEEFGYDYGKWVKWWQVHGKSFTSIRKLEDVTDDRMHKLRIRFERKTGGQSSAVWEFVIRKDFRFDRNNKVGEQYVLTHDQMKALFADLREAGLLERKPGPVKSEAKTQRRIVLGLGRQTRQVVAVGPRPAWMIPLEEQFEALSAANEWQRYWDRDRYTEWGQWFIEQRVFWTDKSRDQVDRNRRLKSMIVGSFRFLRPDSRKTAAERLVALMEADPHMRATQAGVLLDLLRAVGGFDDTAQSLAKALAMSRQPETVAMPLIKYLSDISKPSPQPTLELLMENVGLSWALQFMEVRDDRVRAAACAAMWRYGGATKVRTDTDNKLILALDDTSALVRQSAASSLGRRRSRLALPSLFSLLEKDDQPALRKTALMAIGRIGGTKVITRLKAELGGETFGQAEVIAALGETASEDAIGPLLPLYLGAKDETFREIVAKALVKLPVAALGAQCKTVALSTAATERRVAALQLLGRIHIRKHVAELRPLLAEGSDAAVRGAAAETLAYYSVKETIPILIARLVDPARGAAARAALVAVTLQAFEAAKIDGVQTRYRTWWDTHKGVSWRVFLLNALKQRNARNVDQLAAWALDAEGKTKPGTIGIHTLLDALKSDEWQIAHAASHALAEIYGVDRPAPGRFATAENRRQNHSIWSSVARAKGN